MTVGIYALYWEEQDLIYIGQSQNIEARFKEHIYKLKNSKHTNYKVQHTFDLYGDPHLNILETCGLDRLNDLEIYYTKEFDSINKGLNIIEAGSVGWGVNSNASKYTKVQILLSFRELCCIKVIPYAEISEKYGVSISTLVDIKVGKSHLWLQNKYPHKYEKMTSIDRTTNTSKLNSLYLTNPVTILSPEGTRYVVSNIRSFCKEHNLHNTSLGEVIRGKRKHHKQWILL